MTVGHQVSDNLHNVTTGCGPSKTGQYWEKSWSGADSPPGSNDRKTDHPYTCNIMKGDSPLIEWSFKHNPSVRYTGTISSCFGGPPAVMVPWDSNDDLKLMGKLSSKIRKNDFNGDAFIAEGRQTLALLTSTASRLAGFLESVRHGNVYKAASYLGGPRRSTGKSKIVNTLKRELTPNGKSTGSLQNAILEVQYGWRPLLQDAHSFGTALAAIYEKTPIQNYRVRRKKSLSGIYVGSGGVNYNIHVTKTVWLKVTVTSEPGTRQILHMNDPLAAAWELTPWSFIADWFIPIGSYLQAVNLSRELQISHRLTSEKVTYDALVSNGGDNYIIYDGSGYRSSTMSFKRTLGGTYQLADVPVPSLKPLSKVFSPEHTLNAFALLTSKSSAFNKTLKF